jgi:hypothetical protein
MYQCTGCGKTHTRKPDKDHDCKENCRYVLAHRETGLTCIDVFQKRRSLDKEIDNNIDEQINIIPRKPLTPIRDTILNKSHKKSSAYHPYVIEKPVKTKQVIPSTPQQPVTSRHESIPDDQEIVIKQPLSFDESLVEPRRHPHYYARGL